jgi:hypothetical protein
MGKKKVLSEERGEIFWRYTQNQVDEFKQKAY